MTLMLARSGELNVRGTQREVLNLLWHQWWTGLWRKLPHEIHHSLPAIIGVARKPGEKIGLSLYYESFGRSVNEKRCYTKRGGCSSLQRWP